MVAGGELLAERDERDSGVREAIAESWRRSLDAGLDPAGLLAPTETDSSEALELWQEHPLGSLASVVLDQLRSTVEDTRRHRA
jgi:transcriptional regulator of acetoin/glycerol metabolism